MMIRTRAAALFALAVAASWSAACSEASQAFRARPSAAAAPASTPYGAAAEPAPPAESEAMASPTPDRPGLGTEFGESVDSRVVDQPFERAAAEPFALVALHYNDEDGVRAQADARGGALGPLTASTPMGGISI